MKKNKNGIDYRKQKKKIEKESESFEKESLEAENRIEGRNPVLEALKSDHPIDKLYMDSGDKKGSILKIIRIAKEKGVLIKYVDRKKLDELSVSRSHQGVIAEISAYETYELEDLIGKQKNKKSPAFFLILDEIMDPHNLGSMIRTGNAAGIDGVIIGKRRSVGLTTTVAKVAQGALEHVPVAKVTNIAQAIDYLKGNNIWVAGADMGGEKIHYEADLLGPIAIVIGGEGKGLSELTKKKCDFLVRLPMEGSISSLNASVAGAIMMYEVVRQRNDLRKEAK